jgi:hypothetical protein
MYAIVMSGATLKPVLDRSGGHRMSRRFIVPALGFLLLAPVCALGPAVRSADAFHEATVRAEGGAWFPTLEVEARSSREGLAGDLVTERDLHIDDPDYVIQGSITLRIAKRHTIRAEGFGFSVEGSGPLSRTFNFDGDTFPVSTVVSSEADIAFFGADYGFDLVHNEILALNLTLGARVVTGEASIRAPSLTLEGKGELSTAMPAIGLGVILHPLPIPLLSSLALSARIAGGTIGDEGSFIDAEGGVEWLPIPILALRIGYRYFWGKGERDRDEAEVTLMGPYASVTLSF